jgi:hypothetical protein
LNLGLDACDGNAHTAIIPVPTTPRIVVAGILGSIDNQPTARPSLEQSLSDVLQAITNEDLANIVETAM